MGYHTITVRDIEPHPAHESTRHSLKNVLDLEHVGMSVYFAAPGEQIPQHYHKHEVQEELFYVVEGEIEVETPEETFAVSAGQVFVVEAGYAHRAYTPEDAEGTAHVVAIGAPIISDGIHLD